MTNLVASFGNDYFIIDSSAYPEFIVTSGYEDCVLINGVSLKEIWDDISNHITKTTVIQKDADQKTESHSYDTIYLDTIDFVYPNLSNLQNSYDPEGKNYVAYNSAAYLLHSESYKQNTDSSLFIVKNIPPKLSYVKDIRYYAAPSSGADKDKYTIYKTTDGNYLYHIHIDSSTEFGFALGQKNNDGTRTDASYCSIAYSPGEVDEQKYNKVQKMVDNTTSYELLRANPKLTGNVKVVVDSSSNIYLDTFKVSKGLSQRKYRKIKLNPNEYYGNALMSKMSSLSSDDFYKVENSCYSIFSLANNLGDQYYDKYNSGTRTNNDKMYSENFSILAPLCIKKNMPDFFLIFKIKNYENITNSSDRLKYFLSNGTLIKSFDLRKDSNAGKLMRSVYEHSKDFVGDLFVSYDYDQDNVYNGISLDRGVVSCIHESAALERYIKNQVYMNDWYTGGFERNRIVSKNIINFEFMFDDPSEELFSINTYFGLYVRLNGEDTDFSCIGILSDKTPVFDDYVSGSTFDPDSSLNLEIIYGMSTIDDFIRLKSNITNKASYDDIKDYISKPYQNIASPSFIEMSDEIYNKSFASITVNTVMDVGEHYRIVDFSNYKIYEVVLSNYIDEEFDISDVNTYTKEMYTGTFEINRVTVYGIDYRQRVLTGSDAYVEQTRKRQIQLVSEAFNSFGSDVISAYSSDESLSIVYNQQVQNGMFDIIIEKVSSFVGMTHEAILAQEEYSDNSTSFFNDSLTDKIILTATDSGKKEVLYPHGFEALGNRIVYCYSFVPFESNGYKMYMVDSNIEIELSKEKTIIFKADDGTYAVANPFKIYALNNDFRLRAKTVWTIPGFEENGTYLIRLPKTPSSINGKLYFYNLYPINAGVCSIFPVKDIYTDILDATNKISTEQNDYISSTGGEFTSARRKNVFGESVLYGDEENVMHYLDKVQRFTSYKTSNGAVNDIITLGIDNLTGYLSALNTGNHKYSDLSILFPCCCKWKVLGTDSRGDNMRVMYTYDTSRKNNSYFIPDENEPYIGAITVSDGSDSSISDTAYGSFDSSTKGFPKYINSYLDPRSHPTFRDFLFNGGGSLDDIIHNTAGGGEGIFSSSYINGKDTVEFISGGLKLRIRSLNTSIFDVSKYNGYSSILICCSGNNPKRLNPCEVLIDEIHEQIAVIIYNGSAPFQMFYNENNAKRTVDGTVKIPAIYPVFHKTSINQCTTTYLEYGSLIQKAVLINDDSSMWGQDSSVQLVAMSSENGLGILISPVIDKKSYIKDKNGFLIGKVNNVSSFNETYADNSISMFDSSVIIDNSIGQIKYSTFKNELNKVNESIDMYIVSDLPANKSSIQDTVIEGYSTDYATLPLEIVRSFLDEATLTLKTEDQVYDYSSVNGLFTLSIVEPVESIKENSNFESLNSDYPLLVHPAYTEPVTKNILSFKYNSGINSEFKKSFDGCNIRVSDIATLDQIWLKKFSTMPLTSGSRKTITHYVTSTLVDFGVTDASNMQSDIVVNDILKEVSESAETTNGRYIVINDSSVDKSETVFTMSLTSEPFDKTGYAPVSVNTSFYFDNNENNKFVVSNVVDSNIIDVQDDPRKQKYASLTVEIKGYPIPSITSDTIIKISNGGIIFNLVSQSYDYHMNGTLQTRLLSGNVSSSDTIRLVKESAQQAFFDANIIQQQEVRTKETISGQITSTTGFSVLHGMDPLVDCWHTNMYRTFNGLDTYISNNGINSGYEKNIFFASRGINFKHNEGGQTIDYIEITDWKNTIINRNKKTMILDVTESIINKIMYSEGYLSNWYKQTITEPGDKRRYIENSILPLINIDEKCIFEMYESPIRTNRISLNSSIVNALKDSNTTRVSKKSVLPIYKKVENMSNTLYKENNKYYMRIEGLNSYTYSAKMKIYL